MAAAAPTLSPVPPNGFPAPEPQPQTQLPPHLQGYPQGFPQAAYPVMPAYPQGYPPPPPPNTVTPGALYQFTPYGQQPKPMSLTGQLRLFEADEMPAQYLLSGSGAKWIKLVIATIIAVSAAAGVTFFIIRSTRDTTPSTGSIQIISTPPRADVLYDDQRLTGVTPMTIDNVPVGTRHQIKVELPRHKPFTETVDIPKTGGQKTVTAVLDPLTGKLIVNTVPDGADVVINGQIRGRTPTAITDVDMESAVQVELRLKGYQPVIKPLDWPPSATIQLQEKFER
jgi:hypothetical protein